MAFAFPAGCLDFMILLFGHLDFIDPCAMSFVCTVWCVRKKLTLFQEDDCFVSNKHKNCWNVLSTISARKLFKFSASLIAQTFSASI